MSCFAMLIDETGGPQYGAVEVLSVSQRKAFKQSAAVRLGGDQGKLLGACEGLETAFSTQREAVVTKRNAVT